MESHLLPDLTKQHETSTVRGPVLYTVLYLGNSQDINTVSKKSSSTIVKPEMLSSNVESGELFSPFPLHLFSETRQSNSGSGPTGCTRQAFHHVTTSACLRVCPPTKLKSPL